jgi:hypothetical protein
MRQKKVRPIKTTDLIVLIANVVTAARSKKVGFEDARFTPQEFIGRLNKTVWIDLADLESALWACNLLNEDRKFWHYEGDSFEKFLRGIAKNSKFDMTYNYFEDEKTNG